MIRHIEIRNFAIIKDLSLDLSDGLNILTGETGAGKSIIIEAVSMALGSRADTEYIRSGEEKASITMTVDADESQLKTLFDENGIPFDETIVLHREISSGSKSLCRINGTIVPLSVLNKICKRLADIHGQYDHQNLLDPENHISVLDAFGGERISDVRSVAARAYSDHFAASSELAQIRKRLNDGERQKELLRFELHEIESADPYIGEDDELSEKIRLMRNSEKIWSGLANAREALFSSDRAALSALSDAITALKQISGFSAEIDEAAETLDNAYYTVDDLNGELRRIADSVSYSEEDLDEAEERLALLSSLKRRFGGSLENVLSYAREAKQKLSLIENADERIAELEALVRMHLEEYNAASHRLTQLRTETAEKLSREITRELSELNFHNAEFAVSITEAPMSANGSDHVEFLISANRGEILRPLAKVASGGELSRIMLAMKRILGDIDAVPTLIFDEIDTGISGATAGIVGSKLQSISEGRQVICITHLPQIACLGKHHYRIEKTSDAVSTSTTVVPLNDEERTEEIARLLSGETITDAARTQAKELIYG